MVTKRIKLVIETSEVTKSEQKRRYAPRVKTNEVKNLVIKA